MMRLYSLRAPSPPYAAPRDLPAAETPVAPREAGCARQVEQGDP